MAENSVAAATRDNKLNRRQALKAGAALGVGVAAWTGPQIGRLGAAPAYAGVCSPGEEKCISQLDQSTNSGNCGNSGPPNGLPQAIELNGVFGTITLNGLSATVTAYPSAAQAGKLCTYTEDVKVVTQAGITCRVKLIIGGISVADQVTTTGTTIIDIPPLTKGTVPTPNTAGWIKVAASARYSFSVCCTTDPDDCDNLPNVP